MGTLFVDHPGSRGGSCRWVECFRSGAAGRRPSAEDGLGHEPADDRNGEDVDEEGGDDPRSGELGEEWARRDAMITFASHDGVWELKRTRTEDPVFPARPV